MQSKITLHKQKYGWINTGERGKHEWEEQDFLIQLKNLLSINKTQELEISTHIKNELNYVVQININDNVASDLQIELDFLFQRYLEVRLGINYVEEIIERLSFEEIKYLLQNPTRTQTQTQTTNACSYVCGFSHVPDQCAGYCSTLWY